MKRIKERVLQDPQANARIQEEFQNIQSLYSQRHELICGALNYYRRKFLVEDREATIRTLIELNICPRIIELIQSDELPDIQFQCSWLLIELTSGTSEQTSYIADFGIIPIFCEMVAEKRCSPSLLENLIWILGNIAEAGSDIREEDSLLLRLEEIQERRIFPYLLPALAKRGRGSVSSTIARTCWKLCLSYCPQLLPELRIIADTNNESDNIRNCCKMLYEISRDYSADIMQSGCVPKLLEYFNQMQDPSTLWLFLVILGDCLIVEESRYFPIQRTICQHMRELRNVFHFKALIQANLFDRLLKVFCWTTDGELRKLSLITTISLVQPQCQNELMPQLESCPPSEFTFHNNYVVYATTKLLQDIRGDSPLYQKFLQAYLRRKIF